MLAPPSVRQQANELRVGFDLLRGAVAAPRLRSVPRGRGAPVLLVPGFGAGDASLLPLRAFLRSIGHDTRAAGLGRVSDDVEALVTRLGARVLRVADERGQAVGLVGWSLGGVLCREAARDHPDAVRRVITLASPVAGGPSYTALAWRYTDAELEDIRAGIADRDRIPLRVPVTAIWSRNDGIVLPEACLDANGATTEHVEVRSTHLGMGVDPDVWATVADRLARP